MLFDKIRPVPFFIAFAVGILICYLTNPVPELVIKFPTPGSAGNIIYRDKLDNCFIYRANKVACPQDSNKIRPQPVTLEDFETSLAPK